MSQFSGGLVALAETILQGAKAQDFSLDQIERAISGYNASSPVQRWSFKRHRNGALARCGRRRVDLPRQGVFVQPDDWVLGWDDKLEMPAIEITYRTSVGWGAIKLLEEIGLLHSAHPNRDLISVYIPDRMDYARHFLRSEADHVLAGLQREFAAAFMAELSKA